MPFTLDYEPSRFSSPRPGYDGTSLQDAARAFATEEACFDHVLQRRLEPEAECKKCHKVGHWYRRRGYKYLQHACGAAISPLAGTLLHATKLPLRLWFYAMLHFANSHEGVNSGFLERQLGIGYLAAFRMAHKIRLHMAAIEELSRGSEQYDSVHARLEIINNVRTGPHHRDIANILLAAAGQRVEVAVIDEVRRHTVKRTMSDLMPGQKEILTTCYRTSRVFAAYGARKPLATFTPCHFIDHLEEVDTISGFMSYFLWPFRTNHRHVSHAHLWLYLKEFQFRYNRRHRSRDTYWDMVSAFPQIFPKKLSGANSLIDPGA